jgi:hypothetical protein
MKKYLIDHPLTNCVLWAFSDATKKKGEFACPYKTELTAVHVAHYLMGTYQARELKPGEPTPNDLRQDGGNDSLLAVYEPVARDAMSVMVGAGFLVKVGEGRMAKGDTACRISGNIDLSIFHEEATQEEPSRGLSSDWLDVCEALDPVIFSGYGLLGRFSTSAVLAGLNYHLVSLTWKEHNQPDDPAHAFLECPIYVPFCMHLDEMTERIEPFELFPTPPGL